MIKLDDIRKHAARRPDHVAVVDRDFRLTWAELAEQVARVASGLAHHLPAERPARAAFMSCNSWELVVVMAACATLGVPCIGLDYTTTPEATAGALEQLQPTVLISTPLRRPLLEQSGWPGARDVLGIHLAGPENDDYDTGPAAPGAVCYQALASFEAVPTTPVEQPFTAFSFTSGTSGIPKLVIRNSSFEARRLSDLVDQFSFDEDDVHMVTVPLYHSSGPGWARISLSLGGTVVLSPYEDAGKMAELIVSEGVSTTLMVPPVLNRLISHPASEHLHKTSRLRFLLSGGRHLNRWVINQTWDRLGPVLHLYYGTTETGLNTMIGPEELHVAPARSGRPMPGSTILVLDPEHRPLPKGRLGRIAIASYQLMDSYAAAEPDFLHIEHAGRTQKYLLTGDSGVMDEGGRIELSARNDGVTKAEGRHPLDVNIFALEDELTGLPCVRETAVLKVDLPDEGPTLVAAFAPISPEREASGSRAVLAACLRRAPQLPARVVTVPEIPYSPTGKVRTAQLLSTVLDLIGQEDSAATADRMELTTA
ncbi:class I adenylate-forming enzyme family protein [Kitasatospora sp. NPDC085879]|uniref:class I adenylate-forming enzyme family protein n=1 Tax=Kitasatospora sp. NPDC085879 TaxID=3154769 RepID=UPI00341A6861